MADRDHAEVEARALLAAMQPRLGEPAHALLGVPAGSTPEILRAAFLRLTKVYHPTRYARFAPDVVRLANEVFLTIKRAYDQLHAAPRAVAQGTGSVPARTPGATPASARPAPTSSTPPRAATPTPPPRAATPTPAPSRAATAPATATPRAPTAPVAAPPRAPAPTGARPRVETPPIGTPKVSFTPPAPAAAAARARTSSAPPATRALTPEEQALEPAMELMRRKLWSEARQALLKLAVASPQDKRYRAWMHYARGRESLDASKPEEARAEWGRALGLDPDLTVARRALEELPPEPPAGGLLGRLFGKK